MHAARKPKKKERKEKKERKKDLSRLICVAFVP